MLLILSATTLLVAVLWVFSRLSAEPSRLGLPGSSPQLPTSVRPVLEWACLDCHSNETKWPWYNRVPPVSWLIQRDVDKGREHLNFSTWTGGTPRLATTNEIQEICDAVSDGAMPPGDTGVCIPMPGFRKRPKRHSALGRTKCGALGPSQLTSRARPGRPGKRGTLHRNRLPSLIDGTTEAGRARRCHALLDTCRSFIPWRA